MFRRKSKVSGDDLIQKCMQENTKHRFTATDISSYINSPFHLYCNRFVDPAHRDKMPDQYLNSLSVAGMEHENELADEQFPDAEKMDAATPEEGFEKGIDSMIRGARAILGAPLFYLPEGMHGRTDQMVREGGRSVFGKYHYIIKEVKIARNIKKPHILQAAFYNDMIGKIQNYTPDTFYILNMDKKETPFRFAEYEGELRETLQNVKRLFEGEKPSPTFGSCMYPWSDYCNRMALESRDISLISGISLKKKTKFAEHGLYKLDDIVEAGESKLTGMPGIGEKTARNYVLSARAMLEDKIIKKESIDLPVRKTEIFLDLEGFDALTTEGTKDGQTDYLIGILVRTDGHEEYIPFVADRQGKEKGMLEEFLGYMKKQSDYIIYHWHHYEKVHLTKIMDRYGISKGVKDSILGKDVLYDLHPITTKQYTFPLPNSSLKSIAKYLGFSWKHQDVGAMTSIDLYLSYIHEGNDGNLSRVLDYNRDDCEATKIIKDWLVEQNYKG